MIFRSDTNQSRLRQKSGKDIDQAIRNLKDQINEERTRILGLKNTYTAKLDEKNELERLIRACISDYKDDLWAIKTDLRQAEPQEDTGLEDKLKVTVKDIIDKEKKLTLLYDLMFHVKVAKRSGNSEKLSNQLKD